MVIVNPYLVAGLGYRYDGIPELLVNPAVRVPESLFVYRIEGEIVEERPYGFVGVAVIVVFDFVA
jgi:hypothetical protein